MRLAKALLRHALLSPRCSALLLGRDRQDFGDMTPRRLRRFSLNGICRLKGAAIKMVRCHALTMKIHMVIHWWSIYGDPNIHGDPMIQWSIGDFGDPSSDPAEVCCASFCTISASTRNFVPFGTAFAPWWRSQDPTIPWWRRNAWRYGRDGHLYIGTFQELEGKIYKKVATLWPCF